MRVLTGVEMEAVERQAVEASGISLAELMERAGAAVAQAASGMASRGPVVVVSGKGNNGGDGIVAARLLFEAGIDTRLFLLAPTDDLTPESSAAMRKLEESSAAVAPTVLGSPEDLPSLAESLARAELVIDCVFGFNLRGPARGLSAEVIRHINGAGRPVLAVDLPSGVEADTGQVPGEAVRATRTVTFTAAKLGLAVLPGADYAGTVEVVEIGIARQLVEEAGSVEVLEEHGAAAALPERPHDAHKRSVGRVLVVAGSVGMTGAACLCSQAALRAGAGIVSLAVPQGLNDVFEQKLTEVMTVPMPDTISRSLLGSSADMILDLCPNFDTLVIGPGLSLDDSTMALVRTIVPRVPVPIVLDADGLNAMVNHLDRLKDRREPTIITPHAGELARLLNTTSDQIQADRLGYARRAAAEWGTITVLKGAGTVVSDGSRTVVNPTGNPGLATAGTGDVLAGMIGSFVAQGATALDAATAAAYVHGLAGDLAARELTQRCVIATDVISFLPRAFSQMASAQSDRAGESQWR